MATNIALSAGVKVTGVLPSAASPHRLVRTSTGILYAMSSNASLSIFKSTDNGLTWQLKDYANALSTVAVNTAIVIDSTDTIHIVFNESGTTVVSYMKFNTNTDTYGSVETVIPTGILSLSGTDIAVDNNNIPHIAITGNGNNPIYTNRVRGKWKANVQLIASATPRNINLQIDNNNVPQLCSIDATNGIEAYLGNQNDATSFTTNSITTSVSTGGCSLVIDSQNNTWVTYQAANDGPVMLVKHNSTDPWSTWQTAITDNFTGKQPSLAIDGSNIYVLYERSTGSIAYDRYNFLNNQWLGEQIIQANTSILTTNIKWHNPRVKWTNYFNNGLMQTNNQNQNIIEYLFDNGSTIFYDKLDTAQISAGQASVSFSSNPPTTTSTSSTSSSTSTSTSTSTSLSSTSSSTSLSSTSSSTSTTLSFTTSTSSTSSSISVSSTSSSTSTSISTSTSSTSTSISTSTSSTSSSTSTSKSTSTSSTSTSTSHSTSTSSTSSSTSFSTSSTSQSTSTSVSSTSSSTSISSTSTSLSTTTTLIDITVPIGNIRPQVLTSLPISTQTTLVDDPTALVDDPSALTGSQTTVIPTLRASASSNAPKGHITRRR